KTTRLNRAPVWNKSANPSNVQFGPVIHGSVADTSLMKPTFVPVSVQSVLRVGSRLPTIVAE
ncbi:hypothetical protein, partial [Mesorhizobium sp. M7A.F.Ca.CA.001.09.1.1]